jgi:uncharacterized protein YacL
MLKAHSFLFYLICFLLGFFIGVSYAGFIEAGKDQMLAGGAIVLGYGVIGAVLGLILSLFSVSRLSSKSIVRLNILFAVFILAFVLYYKLSFDRRQKAKSQEKIGMMKIKYLEESITNSEYLI